MTVLLLLVGELASVAFTGVRNSSEELELLLGVRGASGPISKSSGCGGPQPTAKDLE
eukprot:CAMPEP_0204037504 /NCGR_PEP_ID=MMETSP0360-20130528/83552_1 /ASSEMBLY_ACC=CAM_ASM_000342 /TAXON_ID=268821 /ORGANISM="Scrippsiella Hangoei, Strain SHTV-5" /LENGTH=56 /DNA_ID=CAMNT_0050982931 /DNA_START=19 /DNA_END=186 /DNA_ORIENTATION=-